MNWFGTWARCSRAGPSRYLTSATSETEPSPLGRLYARGHESGVETEVSFNQLLDFKGGKVMRVRSFLDSEEALEAVGLSE
jgi:hypothetical protein